MRNLFQSICLIFIFIMMFMFPSAIFDGAKCGLLLWYNSVFPTLFPFMIISTLMIKTNTISLISHTLGPLLKRIFHISSSGSFAVIGGLLCGYPMGAKITADLLSSNKISHDEASYLVSFCNNTSPIFMLTFVFVNSIKDSELIIPGMFIYLFSPLICSYLFYSFYYKRIMTSYTSIAHFSTDIDSSFFHNLDISIMKSIESIVQVGGYIVLFSILVSLSNIIIADNNLYKSFLVACLEITNGIVIISSSLDSSKIKWIICIFLSSFGGLCSIAQTNCMLKNTRISIKMYTIEKLITATVTSLLALLYLTIQRIF